MLMITLMVILHKYPILNFFNKYRKNIHKFFGLLLNSLIINTLSLGICALK